MISNPKTPPSLVWVKQFGDSLGRALGIDIRVDVTPTVNPLLFNLTVYWAEYITPSRVKDIWNMIQIWAHKNDCIPYGRLTTTPVKASVQIVIKRRLGNEKNLTP